MTDVEMNTNCTKLICNEIKIKNNIPRHKIRLSNVLIKLLLMIISIAIFNNIRKKLIQLMFYVLIKIVLGQLYESNQNL